MYNKVFGIGSPKTGTSSLGIAFEILGLKHQGWSAVLWDYYVNNDFDPIFKVVEDHDAFEDGPWNGPDLYYQKGVDFYKVLDKRYNNSRFILTVRDIDSWALSHEYHFTTDGRKGRRAKYRIPDYAKHRAQIISNYEERNLAIKTYFKNRPNDLLVMNICAGDRWGTLCPFLKLRPPDRPFPHMNKTKYPSESVSRAPLINRKLFIS
jgi:hypothetical protein